MVNNGEVGEATVSAVAAVINEVSAEIGENIQAKGFREDWDLAAELEHWAKVLEEGNFLHTHVGETSDVSIPLRDMIIMSKAEYDGEAQYTLPERLRIIAGVLRTNVLGTKLMLMVTELAEAMETLRDTGADDLRSGNFGEELADSVIRIFDTAHMINSPVGDEIMRKVDANKSRAYKHGRKIGA